METLKIQIENQDRHGLVYDISRIMLKYHVNIISMEVIKNITYLELPALPLMKENAIVADIGRLPDITDIKQIAIMPRNKQYQQMKTVFDTISEGVIATDKSGLITYINRAAAKMLQLNNTDSIGGNIDTVLPFHSLLKKSLTSGQIISHHEVFIPERNVHYMVSSQPIFDETQSVSGCIALVRSIEAVRKIYQKLTEQPAASFTDILYSSEIMDTLVKNARHYANSSSTILLRGETGCGKELFARAIHNASLRHNNIFLAINCTAIPETLLESELFGYEEGSFTGAHKGGKLGLFELADGGTLFLDEIGDISFALQAKLLRVLQEHTVRRVGAVSEIPIDVRIIAATNRDLEYMMQTNCFRSDLYYRLNVIPLNLPALREHPEDIEILAKHLMKVAAQHINPDIETINVQALQKLRHYDFPGNVRELGNIIERAVNIATTNEIMPDDIVFDTGRAISVNKLPTEILPENLDEAVAQAERNILARAMKKYKTSRKLGMALGVSHTSILRKMKKYGLSFGR
ncbi:sigma 54-interacting transcriptional regulator [Pectinatus frisingensis]|uniref:sigma 54-interacting transcriptional regulator n=1 Tax=Pectinatus frisingensis TaxID=865 RepID=UPI003D803147